MPTSRLFRRSCCTKEYDKDHKLLAGLFVIAVLGMIILMVLYTVGYRTKYYYVALAPTQNSTVVKAHALEGVATAVYVSGAATATGLLVPLRARGGVAASNGVTWGGVVAVCFAFSCGVFIIILLVACMACWWVHKTLQLASALGQRTENGGEEARGGTAPRAKEKFGVGFLLRTLYGRRGGSTGGNSVNGSSAEDHSAVGGSVANHSAGVMAVGNDPAGNRSAADQLAGNHASEK